MIHIHSTGNDNKQRMQLKLVSGGEKVAPEKENVPSLRVRTISWRTAHPNTQALNARCFGSAMSMRGIRSAETQHQIANHTQKAVAGG